MASFEKNSRLIYIDSTASTGDKSKARILFDQHPFSVCAPDRMKLSVVDFSTKRSWHAINDTNRIAHLYDPALDLYTEWAIPMGSYETGAALATAITAGLQPVSTGASCAYDPNTRKLSFTLAGSAAGVYIVCFNVKPGLGKTRHPGISSDLAFHQQTFEVLGGFPSFTEAPVNAIQGTGPAQQVAPFCASLSTLSHIDLRASLLGGNYTSMHEKDVNQRHNLVETNVLCRIPLSKESFGGTHEFIHFTDQGNDVYSIHLDRRSMDSLDLTLTDPQGRPLSDYEVYPGQGAAGLMSFKCVLKWTHQSSAPPHPYVPTMGVLNGSTNVPSM